MSSEPPAAPRSARDVISAAIRENKVWEWLCVSLVVAFPVAGLGVLVAGAFGGDGLMSLSGAVASGFFWPALKYATAVRQANMEVRMLELVLMESHSVTW